MPKYIEDDLQVAISIVESRLSIRKATSIQGIPFAILYSRVKLGRRPKGEYKALALQKLSPSQEKHLAEQAITQEALGVPITYSQIQIFTNRILQVASSKDTVSKNQISKFLYRHPALKTKRTKKIDVKRLDGTTLDIIKQWFRRLVLLAIKDILPNNYTNIDKNSIIEGQSLNSLYIRRSNTKVALAKHPELQIQTTIIEYITAIGRLFNPLVIFKGKDLQYQQFPKDRAFLETLNTQKFTTSENRQTSNNIAL